MNILNILNNLPSFIAAIILEITREAERRGMTPVELLESAGLRVAQNEEKAVELLNRLDLNHTMGE